MKRVIDKSNDSISVDDVISESDGIVAFEYHETVYHLVGVFGDKDVHYGFHAMGFDSNVLYQSTSSMDTIRQALAAGRDVLHFDNDCDFFEWALI